MNLTKKSKKAVVDPVCGMQVVPDKAQFVHNLDGQKYYFCAEACRKSFEEDPQIYLNPIPPKRKGLWCRYLDRLQKATDGKPIKCH